MRYGLIGEKLGHSFSKEIHEKLGKYDYELKEIKPDELESFMKSGCFKGINVTIPYKEAVIPYLDEVSGVADEVGAVNTIVNKNGKLTGYNTDVGGMKMLAEKLGIDMRGKTVLIAGTGGTSKTAAQVSRELGAGDIQRISRSSSEGTITYEQAYSDYKNAEILINTTPVGMFPKIEEAVFNLDAFKHLEGIIDAVYNPLKSKLVITAEERGIAAIGGLYMLVSQAALAVELFCGRHISTEAIDKTYEDLLRRKRNIVLIGMPGCGKTTIGRLLSEKLGREFIDTDEEIIKEVGTEISDIFSTYGERHFRDIESEIIRRDAAYSGRVIATGGGAVLRRENVEMLSLNGILVFLDRSIDELLPTSDRPLADDYNKIKALYEERLPIYKAAADIIVETEGYDEAAAEMIRSAVMER